MLSNILRVNFDRIVPLAISLLLVGCQLQPCYQLSGPITEWNYGIAPFQRIRVFNAPQLHVLQGDTQSVVVRSEENMFQALLFNIDPFEKRLIIEFDEDCVEDIDHFEIFITVDTLKELDLRGGGTVWIDDTLASAELDILISGNADVNINHLNSELLSTDISGAGTVRVQSGMLDKNIINVTGLGSFFGYGLSALETDVDISGVSVVQTTVSDTLRVNVSGTADIYYKGQPHIIENITGNGQVINAN